MKNKISLSLFLITLLIPLYGADTRFDLRKIRWGMLKKAVKKSEGSRKPIRVTGYFIEFRDTILGDKNTRVRYFFIDKTLSKVTIDFSLSRINGGRLYKVLRKALQKKYGKPLFIKEGRYNRALSGLIRWKNKRTSIELHIFRNSVFIKYKSLITHKKSSISFNNSDLNKL